MNSMGVQPAVYYLYGDLRDGLVIFQLYDFIKPGVVDWARVHKQFNKMRMMMEKIGNVSSLLNHLHNSLLYLSYPPLFLSTLL